MTTPALDALRTLLPLLARDEDRAVTGIFGGDTLDAIDAARAAIEASAIHNTEPGSQAMTEREQFESARKAWARLCNKLHSSPDAPYPGMSEAFEQHFSQSFTDREWRAESATWAAAWKAAKRHEAQGQPASSEGSITAGILSGMFLSLDGHDKAQPGYEWRKGWNDAIRQAMDYAQPAPSEPVVTPKMEQAFYEKVEITTVGSIRGLADGIKAAMLAAAPEAKP